MEKTPETEALARQAKQALDDSLMDIDGETLAKLHRARNRALEASQQPNRFWSRVAWPAAGAAGALVLVLLVQLPQTTVEDNAIALLDHENDDWLELVSAADDVEFYEDLEFFEWLADEQSAG